MGIVDNQTVAIIGGAGDIGRAVAALFAREGARLLIADPGDDADGARETPERVERLVAELKNDGADVAACHERVVTQESAARVIRTCVERFGRLDALIHCAGIRLDQSLEKITEDGLERMIGVHLKGTLFATQAAAAQMKRQKSPGRIVNTTGLAGLLGNFGQLAYSAVSAAVYGITRTASIELQRFDISVNAVAPIAKTRQTADLPMFEHVDTMTAAHVAPAYLFLGSPLCRDLTGSIVAVAGAKLSVLGMAESAGQFKEETGGIWTAAEIGEHWEPLNKI